MAKYLPKRSADIAEAMGIAGCRDMSSEELASALASTVRAMMRKIGIPSCADMNVTSEMMASCGDYATTEKLRGLCGAPVTDDEIRQALVNCVTEY